MLKNNYFTFSIFASIVISLFISPTCFAQKSLQNPYHVNSRWVHSEDLKPGMKVLTADGRALEVIASWQQNQKSETTYNFEVAYNHTYFVDESKVWVHNNGECVSLEDVHNQTPANEPNYQFERADNIVPYPFSKTRHLNYDDGLVYVRENHTYTRFAKQGNKYYPVKNIDLKNVDFTKGPNNVYSQINFGIQEANSIGATRMYVVFDTSASGSKNIIVNILAEYQHAGYTVQRVQGKFLSNPLQLEQYAIIFE